MKNLLSSLTLCSLLALSSAQAGIVDDLVSELPGNASAATKRGDLANLLSQQNELRFANDTHAILAPNATPELIQAIKDGRVVARKFKMRVAPDVGQDNQSFAHYEFRGFKADNSLIPNVIEVVVNRARIPNDTNQIFIDYEGNNAQGTINSADVLEAFNNPILTMAGQILSPNANSKYVGVAKKDLAAAFNTGRYWTRQRC